MAISLTRKIPRSEISRVSTDAYSGAADADDCLGAKRVAEQFDRGYVSLHLVAFAAI